MFSFFHRILQAHFLKADIQAKAFDSFYLQLLKSSYPNFSKDIQGHNFPCYNLLSHNELREVKTYLSSLNTSLLDYGCGLSFICDSLAPKIKMRGIDFCEEALKYNRDNYGRHEFQASHLNLTPDASAFDHILINDSFYHFKHPLMHIQKLLKFKPQSIYWVHNFKEELQDLSIKGYNAQIKNYTDDFKNLVNSWLAVLNSSDVQQEREIFPLIWDTLEKEMNAHKKALQKKEVHRIHIELTRL